MTGPTLPPYIFSFLPWARVDSDPVGVGACAGVKDEDKKGFGIPGTLKLKLNGNGMSYGSGPDARVLKRV